MNSLVPTEWITDELVRFCDIVGGGTPDRAVHEYWGGQIPWVSPTEVTSLVSKYISKTKEGLTQLGLDKSSAKLHPPGTLLMTSRASIGYVAINTVPMATNQGFQSLRCKDGALADYMYQYITWVRPELERLSAGSTFSEISSVNVKRLRVTLPPLPEQQKIATILSSVDNVIEKTRAQIDKLKDLKTGMMQELLTKGIGHTEFKDSPVGRIPSEWQCEKIGALFEVQLGKMLSKAAKVGNSSFPYLGNKNVQWGRVDINDLEEMNFSDSERQKFSLECGDLLICEGGDAGRSAIWEGELENCYYQKAIHRLRPINEAYEPRLLLEYMKYAKTVNLLVNFISQTSIAHLTRTSLISIQIPVPPLAEQKQIVDICSSVDSRIYATENKLTNIKKIKRALMQDLLTGKVRVNLTEKE